MICPVVDHHGETLQLACISHLRYLPGTETITPDRRHLTLEDPLDPMRSIQLARNVQRTVVQFLLSSFRLGLTLKLDSDVLDRTRQDRVGNPSESSGSEQFSHAQVLARSFVLGEISLGSSESSKLNRYACSDTEKRSQGSLIESTRTLIFENLDGDVEGSFVSPRW